MSGHKLTITNPTGEAVFTKVELDGQTQYVNSVSFHNAIDARGRPGDLTATLVYPVMAVECSLENVTPDPRYRARLYIAGYEGVREEGYGATVAAAIHDLASRCEVR